MTTEDDFSFVSLLTANHKKRYTSKSYVLQQY